MSSNTRLKELGSYPFLESLLYAEPLLETSLPYLFLCCNIQKENVCRNEVGNQPIFLGWLFLPALNLVGCIPLRPDVTWKTHFHFAGEPRSFTNLVVCSYAFLTIYS